MANKGTLLVVDDTPASLKLLTEILRGEGYDVRSAISGELALTAAITEPPDLVLLDILMPEMDGFEVCRKLKARPETCYVPVIFVSALSETTEKVQGFGLGAVDFVNKPYQREELLARINTHLNVRKMQKHISAQNAQLRANEIQLVAQSRELEQARKAAQQESDNSLRLALEAGKLGNWEMNLAADTAKSSRRNNEIFGFNRTPPDWGLNAFLRSVVPEDRAWVASEFQTNIERNSNFHFDCRIHREDGELRWIEIHAEPFQEAANKPPRLYGITIDVTERKRNDEQLKFHPHHDPLTKLPSRLLMEDRFSQAAIRAGRTKSKAALLFVDLDNLSSIIDARGHSIGDAVIDTVATRLMNCVEETDSVGRLGIGEFLIMRPDLNDDADLPAFMDKVRKCLPAQVVVGSLNVSVSASVGIAVYPDDGGTFDALTIKGRASMR